MRKPAPASGVEVETEDFPPASASVCSAEVIPWSVFASVSLKPSTSVPSEASSDCQPARKLSAPGASAVINPDRRCPSAARRALCLVQARRVSSPCSNLDGGGNGHAEGYSRRRAKGMGCGLEHCHKWNRQSPFRKPRSTLHGFSSRFPCRAHIPVDGLFGGGIRLTDEFCHVERSSFTIVPFTAPIAAQPGAVPVVERLLAAPAGLEASRASVS